MSLEAYLQVTFFLFLLKASDSLIWTKEKQSLSSSTTGVNRFLMLSIVQRKSPAGAPPSPLPCWLSAMLNSVLLVGISPTPAERLGNRVITHEPPPTPHPTNYPLRRRRRCCCCSCVVLSSLALFFFLRLVSRPVPSRPDGAAAGQAPPFPQKRLPLGERRRRAKEEEHASHANAPAHLPAGGHLRPRRGRSGGLGNAQGRRGGSVSVCVCFLI